MFLRQLSRRSVAPRRVSIVAGAVVVGDLHIRSADFVGIKQRLSPSWSFDFGYMPVFQQKSGGDQYDLNNTLRLFVYFTPDLRGSKSEHEPAGNDE